MLHHFGVILSHSGDCGVCPPWVEVCSNVPTLINIRLDSNDAQTTLDSCPVIIRNYNHELVPIYALQRLWL